MKNGHDNTLLTWIVRIFVALSVISFGVFRHLFGWEESAGSLLEGGLASSSKIALIEVHLMTILELIFLVCTIACRINRFYVVFAGVLTLIYTLSFVTSFSNVTFVNADLSSVNGWMGFPIAIVMFGVVAYVYYKQKDTEPTFSKWVALIAAIILVGGYSTYFYPTKEQFVNLGNDYEVKYANWDRYWEVLGEEHPAFIEETDYLICFFSTSCEHCNEAARRVGVYQRKYPDRKILGVFFAKTADGEFWESDTRVEEFLTRNHLELPYLKMKDYEVVSISDNQFPVVVEMKDKKPEYLYVGNELNAWAFDHLFTAH